MHKFLFCNTFIIRLYMFRALCAHHEEVKIVFYSIGYRHSCRWPSDAQVEERLIPLSTCSRDGHSKHVEVHNKLIIKQELVH